MFNSARAEFFIAQQKPQGGDGMKCEGCEKCRADGAKFKNQVKTLFFWIGKYIIVSYLSKKSNYNRKGI
jgi:hypothetical protein